MEKTFRQIATGQYTYRGDDGEILQSHCIYGLDENGVIWKWQVKARTWILLTDTRKYDTD